MSKKAKSFPPGTFLSDVTQPRQRARREIGEEAVTSGYKADRETAR